MARSNRTSNQSATPNTRPDQPPTPTRRLTPTGTGLLGSSNLFGSGPTLLSPLGSPAPGCLHREGDGSGCGPPGSEFVLPQPRAGRAPAAGTDPRVGTADTRRPPHRRNATADRRNMGNEPRGRPGPGPLPAARPGPAATGPGRPRNRDLTTRSAVPRFVGACRTPDLRKGLGRLDPPPTAVTRPMVSPASAVPFEWVSEGVEAAVVGRVVDGQARRAAVGGAVAAGRIRAWWAPWGPDSAHRGFTVPRCGSVTTRAVRPSLTSINRRIFDRGWDGLCTTRTALPRNRHLPGETPRARLYIMSIIGHGFVSHGPRRPAHDPNTPRPPVCATPTCAGNSPHRPSPSSSTHALPTYSSCANIRGRAPFFSLPGRHHRLPKRRPHRRRPAPGPHKPRPIRTHQPLQPQRRSRTPTNPTPTPQTCPTH